MNGAKIPRHKLMRPDGTWKYVFVSCLLRAVAGRRGSDAGLAKTAGSCVGARASASPPRRWVPDTSKTFRAKPATHFRTQDQSGPDAPECETDHCPHRWPVTYSYGPQSRQRALDRCRPPAAPSRRSVHPGHFVGQPVLVLRPDEQVTGYLGRRASANNGRTARTDSGVASVQ